MTKITNKTQKPLRVPLPQGKTLHLGPGRSGEVSPKATDHPPFKALVEAGDIEIHEGKTKRGGGTGGGSSGLSSSQGHTPGGGIRHTGDR